MRITRHVFVVTTSEPVHTDQLEDDLNALLELAYEGKYLDDYDVMSHVDVSIAAVYDAVPTTQEMGL